MTDLENLKKVYEDLRKDIEKINIELRVLEGKEKEKKKKRELIETSLKERGIDIKNLQGEEERLIREIESRLIEARELTQQYKTILRELSGEDGENV